LNGVKTLAHSINKALGSLSVIFTVEDTPLAETWLLVHLALNLSINIHCVLSNIELIPLSILLLAHDHLSWLEHLALGSMGVLGDLNAPFSHFLDALLILLERFQESFAFFNSSFGIGVSHLAHIFHQSEISSHAF